MTLPRELLEAICARPDDQPPNVVAPRGFDRAGYLVAADWLVAQGEPWGELIAAQARLEGETDPGAFLALKRRADALVAQHGDRWLGAPGLAATWRWGFVERLIVPPAVLPAVLASEVGALTRELVLEGTASQLSTALREVHRRAPSRLDALTLRGSGRQEDPSPCASGERLGEGPSRAPGSQARALARRRPEPGAEEVRALTRGEVAHDAPLPPLRRLDITGLALDWRTLPSSLTELRVADLHPSDALARWLEHDAPSTFARLELLDLELAPRVVQAVVARQAALEALHVEDDLPDELARWLAEAPALSRLSHLALGGPATDVGLEALLTHAARFSRLSTLILYGGRFGANRRRWAYKQLPRIVFAARRPAGDWTQRRRGPE